VTTVAELVRHYPGMAEAPPPRARTKKKGVKDATKLLLRHRLRRLHKNETLAKVAMLANIFERAKLEIALRRGHRATKRFIDRLEARYDLALPGRLAPDYGKPGAAVRVSLYVR
jgi:hypothetical protein